MRASPILLLIHVAENINTGMTSFISRSMVRSMNFKLYLTDHVWFEYQRSHKMPWWQLWWCLPVFNQNSGQYTHTSLKAYVFGCTFLFCESKSCTKSKTPWKVLLGTMVSSLVLGISHCYRTVRNIVVLYENGGKCTGSTVVAFHILWNRLGKGEGGEIHCP